MKDLRYALRMLFKRPGLALTAIMTLGLGIGANTIIFSGVYTLLLQSLPYPNAERLMIISQTSRAGAETGVSYADFSAWKEQSDSFDQMAASKNINVNLTDRQPVERVSGSLVTEEFFPLLGIHPLIGRGFLAEDFRAGSTKAVILSYVFWQRKFGGSEDVIGNNIRLNDEPFTIIGVMPASFQHPFRCRFWTPLREDEKPKTLQDRSSLDYQIIAALKSDASRDQATSEMAVLAHRSNELNDADEEMAVKVASLRDSLPGRTRYRAPLLVLQFAVLFVLLIASVNLANLLLAQTTERRQEFAVRLALGASRRRIARQLITESFLLSLLGTATGMLLAEWGIGALRSGASWRIPVAAEVEINTTVLIATLSVSLLTSFIFGLAPALMASRQDLNEILKSSPASDPRRRRLSKSLVMAEVAMAVVLLAASGLMIRTFLNLIDENPGFDIKGAVAVSIALPRPAYPNYESCASYYEDAIERIRAIPGVESAGGVTYPPLIGYNPQTDFTIEGRDTESVADFQPVTADYFQAIGMPLLRGRMFTDADMKSAPDVAIINEALAKKHWPDEEPLGKQIRIKGIASPLVVAGIVGDVKQFGLDTDPRPEIYVPSYRLSMTLIARANASPARLFAALEEAVAKESRAAVSIKTIEDVVSDSIERRRIFAQLMTALAAVALALATMGIYGVMSYSVSQRTREIGIRMALGAYRRDVLRLVVGQGMRLAAGGLAIGLIASFALTRALRSMLYQASATDPVMIMILSLIMMAVAAAASFVPARRATRVDPQIALRHE